MERKQPWRWLVVPLALMAAGTATAASPYEANVVRVIDGDTLEIERPEGRTRVRLAQIDAPEKAQTFGPESTRALETLALGRRARVVVTDTDRYGRAVAEIYVDGLHVNREMVRTGHAWVYQRYAVDPELNQIEQQARSDRAGLWALPETERLAPWSWRAAGRAAPGRNRELERARTEGALACAGKRLCGEMKSCEEAMFYLNTCGLKRLDGDRDGVPCESLCSQLAGEPER